MTNSLDIFINEYCTIGFGDYIKLSRFKDCYKKFCNDTCLAPIEFNENIINKHDIELVYMNGDKWLYNIRMGS